MAHSEPMENRILRYYDRLVVGYDCDDINILEWRMEIGSTNDPGVVVDGLSKPVKI